ncbi:MAG: hypothetical protein KA314_09125 [Chloroflexi bacterium]|nr:hypothetical protein [Chloroflexota bacterium]MBP8055992.1 hypothetical protein [Chloroflexota bacterium]
MAQKLIHEPKATLMSADEVWGDAQEVTAVLRQNLLEAEPVVRLQIPFSSFLSALDGFNRDELVVLRQRLEERLATA